ncbi:MAG: hypothetical protein NZ959_06365 [Armatimonadetes bacterium]|nr:hypothetical protein [Armatimonadota bacterium]MDW8122034.1 hypothetical protein [Armatimonadota bacterium]
MGEIREGSPFDAAPFGMPLPQGIGWRWEDIRELHCVVVTFAEDPPSDITLEYWKSTWPERRLPKDKPLEGGLAGWFPMGDWFNGTWQQADADILRHGTKLSFTFRPINQKEFPQLHDFSATYRTTYQIRFVSATDCVPQIQRIQAYTDSLWTRKVVSILWEKPPQLSPCFSCFNGHIVKVNPITAEQHEVTLFASRNSDPNTFDKTLLTIQTNRTLTVLVDDLQSGPIWIPDFGIAVVEGPNDADYGTVAAKILAQAKLSRYDAIKKLPEQTWDRAWEKMPPKRSLLYLPLGTDGGRHKFRINPDGSIVYRTKDRYLISCVGKDTERLRQDEAPIEISFGLKHKPYLRTIEEGYLPIGLACWKIDGYEIQQETFVTILSGTDPGKVPESDETGVLMVRFIVTHQGANGEEFSLPISVWAGGHQEDLQLKNGVEVWGGAKLRFLVEASAGRWEKENKHLVWKVFAVQAENADLVLKIPYTWLKEPEIAVCRGLDYFDERNKVREYWRKRISASARMHTPSESLNEFYLSHSIHLLINCDREPGAGNRFARVGSFSYGVYGNESCMMIVDLDRRGYHKEARECLETFLKYQGSVPLPGDYSSQDGVLYGAQGYECGGYNQHHGWILWCLVEHYRFTGDKKWLETIVPHLIRGAEWIIQERSRTKNENSLIRGLLPCGSLEDITDWWPWLSTNVYSWRGLDAVAWSLEQLHHPERKRLREEAEDYRKAIVAAFRSAAEQSPVVRLRDGTAVPHFPSSVFRRGRSVGWIREVLEGALHLLITRVFDPCSKESLWILKDYEDNLYLSPIYGYKIPDLEKNWFDLGGFSLQACLLYSPEPYLFRDDVAHALRAIFNAIAAYYFPDTRMITEHALELGEWRGDHYKTSDEANAAGWLRFLFVREEGDDLIVGQAVPLDWLGSGQKIGIERTHTYFGMVTVFFQRTSNRIWCHLEGPKRNPPRCIFLRLRHRSDERLKQVIVNGQVWADWDEKWIRLPGDIGDAIIEGQCATEE